MCNLLTKFWCPPWRAQVPFLPKTHKWNFQKWPKMAYWPLKLKFWRAHARARPKIFWGGSSFLIPIFSCFWFFLKSLIYWEISILKFPANEKNQNFEVLKLALIWLQRAPEWSKMLSKAWFSLLLHHTQFLETFNFCLIFPN